MRPLLVLVAALGLPLCALAQSEAQKSPEVSELTVRATRQCPDPGDPHRLDAYRKLLDAPLDTKTTRTEGSPGTRELLATLIAGYRNDNIDYSHIHPKMAKRMREQFPRAKLMLECQGALKGIKFLHVSQAGWNVFEVDFSNGVLEWAAPPFDSHQVMGGMLWWYFYPQPATRRLEDWLKSLERRRPNYADLAPDLASRLLARWPALQTSLKDWGRLKGFRFVGRDGDGAYVYLATYDHRQVVWTASLPNSGGKFTALTYDERAR